MSTADVPRRVRTYTREQLDRHAARERARRAGVSLPPLPLAVSRSYNRGARAPQWEAIEKRPQAVIEKALVAGTLGRSSPWRNMTVDEFRASYTPIDHGLHWRPPLSPDGPPMRSY